MPEWDLDLNCARPPAPSVHSSRQLREPRTDGASNTETVRKKRCYYIALKGKHEECSSIPESTAATYHHLCTMENEHFFLEKERFFLENEHFFSETHKSPCSE